jgi:hypothetical protein
MTLGAGELLRSLVEFVCMSATFPVRKTALPSLGTKLSVEIAVRHVAGRGSTRSGFAGALKMPWNTPL